MPGEGGKLLTIHHWCPPGLQDEMELGYIQAPHKTFPVVFDSPRNGELQNFPYKRILAGLLSWKKSAQHADIYPKQG